MPSCCSLAHAGACAAISKRLCADLASSLRPGDQVLLMSNGSFGGLHERLLQALRMRFANHAHG